MRLNSVVINLTEFHRKYNPQICSPYTSYNPYICAALMLNAAPLFKIYGRYTWLCRFKWNGKKIPPRPLVEISYDQFKTCRGGEFSFQWIPLSWFYFIFSVAFFILLSLLYIWKGSLRWFISGIDAGNRFLWAVRSPLYCESTGRWFLESSTFQGAFKRSFKGKIVLFHVLISTTIPSSLGNLFYQLSAESSSEP